MASGFLVCAAPDSHISYLQQHQGFVFAYLDGDTPSDAEISSPLPEWWPKQPPELLDAWAVNHRNTDLYHWILNGGPELVSGGGSIFQTWFEPDHAPSVVKLDKHNERFAFHPDKIKELVSLVVGVNVDTVHRAFADWCKSKGKRFDDIDQYACQPFVDEFKAFGDLLSGAMQNGYGLIW